MTTFGERDFEMMAKRAVDRFLSRQASLEDAAADEARTNRLNPDQIERMTQAANTEAFLRMMDQRKQEGAGDLMHEFDPIDSRHVIRIVIDQNGVHVEGPDGQGLQGAHGPEMPHDDELPDETAHMNPAEGEPGHTDSPEVEECEEACHEEHDPPGVVTEKKHTSGFGDAPFAAGKSEKKDAPKPPPKKEKKKDKGDDNEKEASFSVAEQQAIILKMRRVADDMRSKRAQAEYVFEEKLGQLITAFRGVYKRDAYEEFEKSALVEHGDEPLAIGVLAQVREGTRQPLEAWNPEEKRAALVDRHVSDDTVELQAFGDLCRIAKTAARLDAGVKWIEERCAI